MNMKKVSVIIPMHNSSKHIKECIESVINQTYSNLEIIVVDDASIANSIELVKHIKDDRIKIIELKDNVGVAITRNTGIKIASGNFICFLDSDDYWVVEKIEKQISFMEKNKCAFVYSGYQYLNGSRKHIAHVPTTINYNEALKNTTIFTSTVMFNMAHLNKEDIYMPNIESEDTATWWKILRKGIIAYGIDEPLSVYRVGEKSLSSNKFKALKRTWNLYKKENLNIILRTFYFFYYCINATKRRVI